MTVDYYSRGKRAAAKQLIERYYYQLKDGCGRPDCTNDNCASSKTFSYKSITANQAAVTAVELLQRKAELCDMLPNKVAKGGSGETPSENDKIASGSSTSSSSESRAATNSSSTLVMTCDNTRDSTDSSKPSTSNQLLTVPSATCKSPDKQVSPIISPQLGKNKMFMNDALHHL